MSNSNNNSTIKLTAITQTSEFASFHQKSNGKINGYQPVILRNGQVTNMSQTADTKEQLKAIPQGTEVVVYYSVYENKPYFTFGAIKTAEGHEIMANIESLIAMESESTEQPAETKTEVVKSPF